MDIEKIMEGIRPFLQNINVADNQGKLIWFRSAETEVREILATQIQPRVDKTPDVIELCNTLADHVHVVDWKWIRFDETFVKILKAGIGSRPKITKQYIEDYLKRNKCSKSSLPEILMFVREHDLLLDD